MTKPLQLFLTILSIAATFMLASACSQGNNESKDAIAPTEQASADTIYHGGQIVTIDDTNPAAEAVAVQAGKIVAVGSEADVMAWRGDGTEVVDLAGKTLLPGFIDAHGHVFNTGLQALSANLLSRPDGTVNDIAALRQTFGDWAANNRHGFASTGWIIGFGYDDSQLDEHRHPTRDDLDKVSLTMPVLAIHQSGHLAAINSKGLELVGITADSADPAGGVHRRYEGSSEPDGVLEEMAFFQVVFSILGALNEDENRALLMAGVDLYASFGYTTAQEGRATAEAVAAMAGAAADNDLIMDVVAYPDIQRAADTIKQPLLAKDYTQGFRIGGAKLSLDGSPQGKTAWLTEALFCTAGRQRLQTTAAIRQSVTKRPPHMWTRHSPTAGRSWSIQMVMQPPIS